MLLRAGGGSGAGQGSWECRTESSGRGTWPGGGEGSRMYGLRLPDSEEAGSGLVSTCGHSLPVISVFSVKLFPMTQSMVWCVGPVFYNCLGFSFAEAR